MLLIRCPYCEMDRPELEFRYAGEAHVARPADPSSVSDEDWAQYLYFRANPRGVHAERWRHTAGCGRFFNAVRHTVTDRILVTYRAGEPRPAVDGLAAPAASGPAAVTAPGVPLTHEGSVPGGAS